MVNVALLTREYPPHVYGGAGVHVDYLSRELARRVEVRVRCFGERDGAVLLSGKVMSREYAYPRYSPGLLPTSVAVAYGYAYAPDYGFAYRLVPPVPAGATCVEQPNLVYNTQGVFVGYGAGYSCY